MVDHFNDLSQDLVASVIKFRENLLPEIGVSKSNLDMDLVSAASVSASLRLTHGLSQTGD
jgi:hypothetical protein